MHDDPINHTNELDPPSQVTAEPVACPHCSSPLRGQSEVAPTRTMGVPSRHEVKQTLPTEEECWREFWTKMAVAWASIPPELQQQCIAEVELAQAGTRWRDNREPGKPRT